MFVLIICFSLLTSFAQEKETSITQDQKFLVDLEIYKATTLKLPLKLELDQLSKELPKQLHLFKKKVLKYKGVYFRTGLLSYLEVLDSLNLQEKISSERDELIENSFSSCDALIDCLKRIKDLAALSLYYPHLSEEFSQHLPQFSKKSRLLNKIYEYKKKSLGVYLQFLSETNLFRQKERTPQLPFNRVLYFKNELHKLDELFYHQFSAPRKSWYSQQGYLRASQIFIDEFLLSLEQEITQETLSKDLANFLANDFFSVLNQTHIGNQSLRLYLNRFNNPYPEKFYSGIKEDLLKGHILPEIVLFMTIRFAKVETNLPYRHEYSELAILSNHLSPLKMDHAVKGLCELVRIRDHYIRSILPKFKFDQFLELQSLDTINSRLFNREKWLLKFSPEFHSLSYQISLMQKRLDQLSSAATVYLDDKNEVNALNVDYAHDQMVEQWLIMAAYASRSPRVQSTPYRDSLNETKLKVYMSSLELDINEIEFLNFIPQNIHDWVFEHRQGLIWKPVKLEIYVNIATLPLTVISGGIAGAASKPVVSFVSKWAGGLVARKSLGKLTSYSLQKILPQLVGAVAGATVFTAVQRIGISTLTLGQYPLYQSNKSLWENYGRDLLTGSAIFFFLPYTANISHRITQQLSQKSWFKKSQVSRQMASLGIHAGMDTAIFTSIPYLERVIQKYLSQSKDPVLRGWEDFYENLGHSASLALAFRLREVSQY